MIIGENSHIPLFPLNNVLFPKMMLPMHIFEERYKFMISNCIDSGEPFGIVLAKSDRAEEPNVFDLSLDDIHPIGTTALVAAVDHLEDGRMNLIALGQDRFIIRDIKVSQQDYLVGQIDPFPVDAKSYSINIEMMTDKLKLIMRRYISHLSDASGEDLSNTNLPTDPEALAFLAATAVQQAPSRDKQRLLSTSSLSELVSNVVSVLDREDKILAYMIKAYQVHKRAQQLPFVDYSLN